MSTALIVEDNATFRQSFKEFLKAEFPSLELSEAREGKEAFEKIEAIHPDLIFMDIKLPGENGLQLTQKIKAHHPDTIVIILTSYDLPEYREAAQRANANYFITKGTSTREILSVIRSALSRQG
jgi:DNA-binding NarL/FixJ family response regulator